MLVASAAKHILFHTSIMLDFFCIFLQVLYTALPSNSLIFKVQQARTVRPPSLNSTRTAGQSWRRRAVNMGSRSLCTVHISFIKHLGDSKSISIEGRIFYGISPHPEAKPLILFKNSRIANRYSQFAEYLRITICNSPRKWGSLFAIRNILPTNCCIVT